MNFGYFRDGLNHFLLGLLFIVIFLKLRGRKEDFTRHMWLGLIIGSSSFFFLPGKLPGLPKNSVAIFRSGPDILIPLLKSDIINTRI